MSRKNEIVPREESNQFVGVSDSWAKELLSSLAFTEKPPPFCVVELPCSETTEGLPDDARIDLSTGPVWLFPYHDRKQFVSYLDDGADIDQCFAEGFDTILAVFRGERFILLPVKSRFIPVQAVGNTMVN